VIKLEKPRGCGEIVWNCFSFFLWPPHPSRFACHPLPQGEREKGERGERREERGERSVSFGKGKDIYVQ